MDLLIFWFAKVPNVVWSAIIASLLTFSGVLWTNKGNERRQNALLEHEKLKFQSEQKLALKKEVFLNVASSFADVLGIIPKLTNLDFSQKEIESRMENHSGIVAKSYLAAKETSVAEIFNYSAETAEVFIDLMKDRAVLLDHKKAIEIYQSTIDRATGEKERIVSIMKEFNIQGREDPATFDYLKKSYEIQESTVIKNTEYKKEEESIIEPLHGEFARKCMGEHGRLLSLISPMTIALRSELDNDNDSEIFINSLNDNILRMNAAFENLLTSGKG